MQQGAFVVHSGRGDAGGAGGVESAELPAMGGTDDEAGAGPAVGTSGSRVVMRNGPSWYTVRSSRVSAGG